MPEGKEASLHQSAAAGAIKVPAQSSDSDSHVSDTTPIGKPDSGGYSDSGDDGKDSFLKSSPGRWRHEHTEGDLSELLSRFESLVGIENDFRHPNTRNVLGSDNDTDNYDSADSNSSLPVGAAGSAAARSSSSRHSIDIALSGAVSCSLLTSSSDNTDKGDSDDCATKGRHQTGIDSTSKPDSDSSSYSGFNPFRNIGTGHSSIDFTSKPDSDSSSYSGFNPFRTIGTGHSSIGFTSKPDSDSSSYSGFNPFETIGTNNSSIENIDHRRDIDSAAAIVSSSDAVDDDSLSSFTDFDHFKKDAGKLSFIIGAFDKSKGSGTGCVKKTNKYIAYYKTGRLKINFIATSPRPSGWLKKDETTFSFRPCASGLPSGKTSADIIAETVALRYISQGIKKTALDTVKINLSNIYGSNPVDMVAAFEKAGFDRNNITINGRSAPALIPTTATRTRKRPGTVGQPPSIFGGNSRSGSDIGFVNSNNIAVKEKKNRYRYGVKPQH